MKIFHKWQILLVTLLFWGLAGCSDFLKEESISDITSDSYYVTETGFEDLTRSCYPLMRDIHQQRELVMLGTDMFTNNAWNRTGEAGSLFNIYDNRLNSAVLELATLWDLLYREIGRTNTVVSRAPNVDMDADDKAIRVSEAKFLRALCYFYLVQQWGDVPMPLEETNTASKEVSRVAAAEVYSQLIADLTEAEGILPATASDYGRATKGAAQFLLARVYLTRGWNHNNSLGGSADDFNKAVQNADKVIAAYPLAANYADLFPKHAENPLEETFPTQNDRNDEIVFAVQFSDDALTNTGDVTGARIQGNDYHSIFGGSGENTPGNLGRSSAYNRHLDKYITTPAMYRLFDPQMDTRYHHNFVDAQYALRNVPGFNTGNGTIDISTGDTVLLFRPWNDPAPLAEKGMDVGGTKPYAVINNDEIGVVAVSPFHSAYQTPLMWKFWEPGIPYGDAFGTQDFAIFRSAEAYLIAAEAIVKGASNGQLGGADVYYNTVVDRALGANAGTDPMGAANPADVTSLAATSYRATAGSLTIDQILDERAREFLGEYMRWYDLKRTGKLIERTSAMNPWTALKGAMEGFHFLRPLPQHELDRSTPSISQNTGY